MASLIRARAAAGGFTAVRRWQVLATSRAAVAITTTTTTTTTIRT